MGSSVLIFSDAPGFPGIAKPQNRSQALTFKQLNLQTPACWFSSMLVEEQPHGASYLDLDNLEDIELNLTEP